MAAQVTHSRCHSPRAARARGRQRSSGIHLKPPRHPRGPRQGHDQPQHLRPVSPSTSAIASTRASGSARTAPFPTRAAFATTSSPRSSASRYRVLRWPGGCFADEYHWRDGIGPREQRPTMINTHWGGVVENNHFGTHEFMDFCEQLGCEPYICGNVGSGSVQEMQQWVEYMTFPGVSPMADLRREEWPRRALEGDLLWRRQRELGLRRQHDRRILRGPITSATPPTCGTSATTESTRSPVAPTAGTTNWTAVLMREVGDAWTGWPCITTAARAASTAVRDGV